MNQPPPADTAPVSATEARRLFADWAAAEAVGIAVSGGPDSMALLWLAVRWRKRLKRGPKLIALTVDHGLRPGATAEARMVKAFASSLNVPHRILRWRGPKPEAGLPAAAREARYRLLAQAARRARAPVLFTAHTQDDQAETLLMRMARGSGLTGLAGMARATLRDGLTICRPLLGVPKARLIATLTKAKVAFADDPTNRDPRYTRPRWRALLPELAQEGLDARQFARLASRLRRADAALEAACGEAEARLVRPASGRPGCRLPLADFLALPEEVQLRLLMRLVDRFGHEGPAELGKAEALLARIEGAGGKPGARAASARARSLPKALTTTLAGALIGRKGGVLHIGPAPPRRHRQS